MKIIFVCITLLFSIVCFAQRSNIAHINTSAVWELLPEKKKADSIIIKLNKEYSEYYNNLSNEIQTLIYKYQNDAGSSPALKADMATDIQNKQQRLETFKKEAEIELAKKNEELMAPIRKKIQDAIDKVAKKNKYLYVLDSSFGNIIYVQNPSDDLMDLVKKELGL